MSSDPLSASVFDPTLPTKVSSGLHLPFTRMASTHLAFTVNFRFSGITIKTVYKCGVQNGEM